MAQLLTNFWLLAFGFWPWLITLLTACQFTGEFMVSTRQQRERRDVGSAPADDNILLVQSIQITDKFGFQAEDGSDASLNSGEPHEKAYAGVAQDKLTCLNGYGKFGSLCENAQSRANQNIQS